MCLQSADTRCRLYHVPPRPPLPQPLPPGDNGDADEPLPALKRLKEDLERLAAAESKAKENGRGLWADEDFGGSERNEDGAPNRWRGVGKGWQMGHAVMDFGGRIIRSIGGRMSTNRK